MRENKWKWNKKGKNLNESNGERYARRDMKESTKTGRKAVNWRTKEKKRRKKKREKRKRKERKNVERKVRKKR